MLLYLDSSAAVKLVSEEPETSGLGEYVAQADLVSSELLVTEVARSIRRAAASDPQLPLQDLLHKADEVLDTIAFVPLERPLLVAAGRIDEAALRTLDALHVAAAVSLSPLDGFVTYDERQSAAARLVGLRTVAPT